jgi:hypothetical protein
VSDLRVLDPAYTSKRRGCILVRDKCAVICIEHVRLIVMRDCVLLPLERSIALTEEQALLVAALERQIREYISPHCDCSDPHGAPLCCVRA